MRREDAEKTTWMILEGLGYRKAENPELEQTVTAVFDTVPKGTWLWHKYRSRCSCCGFGGSKSWSVCPVCGHDMVAEDELT